MFFNLFFLNGFLRASLGSPQRSVEISLLIPNDLRVLIHKVLNSLSSVVPLVLLFSVFVTKNRIATKRVSLVLGSLHFVEFIVAKTTLERVPLSLLARFG